MVDESKVIFKICVLGDSGVGKSSMITQYVEGHFAAVMKTTVAASFFTKKCVFDGVSVELRIWDTAGQERFRSLAPMFYRGAAVALVMYDMTSRKSFERMKSWVKEVKTQVTREDVIVIIAGNKSDRGIREVDEEEVKSFVDSSGALAAFELSAKSNTGIEECFNFIIETLVHKYKESGRSPNDYYSSTSILGGENDMNNSSNSVIDNNNNNNNKNNRNNNSTSNCCW